MSPDLADLIAAGLDPVQRWQQSYGTVEPDPSLIGGPDVGGVTADEALAELGERLTDNFPFHHPRYAAQMLKPPHPVAVAAYAATMLINPNNHALDGGPATAGLELEVMAQLATMFGFDTHLGHLTSSGTIANLEALFVARESHPDRGVVWSADAHYTHSRMCGLLGVPGEAVPVDAGGRMDLDALEEVLRTGTIGTVVATLGTTSIGAIDPIHEIVPLARQYGCRIHVDAAYGGFFRLVADVASQPPADTMVGAVAREPFEAVALADSIVVDPHKHGLQPYGCGAVLFADPAVGRFYAHDSPYTYFTSADLHLGEISIECSRAGAAAAALWTTFRVLPLSTEGLGAVLRPGLRAARRWADLIEASDVLGLYQRPELDIVAYFPRADTLSVIDTASSHVMDELMTTDDPIFLATLGVTRDAIAVRKPSIRADVESGRILRSALMKPEHEDWVDRLHARVESSAAAALAGG